MQLKIILAACRFDDAWLRRPLIAEYHFHNSGCGTRHSTRYLHLFLLRTFGDCAAALDGGH